MARADPQLNFRIPVELRDRLEAAARENNRSLTGELVDRLERSFLQSVEQDDEAVKIMAWRLAKAERLALAAGILAEGRLVDTAILAESFHSVVEATRLLGIEAEKLLPEDEWKETEEISQEAWAALDKRPKNFDLDEIGQKLEVATQNLRDATQALGPPDSKARRAVAVMERRAKRRSAELKSKSSSKRG